MYWPWHPHVGRWNLNWGFRYCNLRLNWFIPNIVRPVLSEKLLSFPSFFLNIVIPCLFPVIGLILVHHKNRLAFILWLDPNRPHHHPLPKQTRNRYQIGEAARLALLPPPLPTLQQRLQRRHWNDGFTILKAIVPWSFGNANHDHPILTFTNWSWMRHGIMIRR